MFVPTILRVTFQSPRDCTCVDYETMEPEATHDDAEIMAQLRMEELKAQFPYLTHWGYSIEKIG